LIDQTPTDKPPISLTTRPWGHFRQYAFNQDCTVSLMTVQPGQRLSLQSHEQRAELWIVLDEGAVVQLGSKITRHRSGDEVWIPAKSKHRLSCDGTTPVRVLEIAFGNWRQDDITRYEDDYKRPAEGE
jgi:mannose-6-phosphate isomerase